MRPLLWLLLSFLLGAQVGHANFDFKDFGFTIDPVKQCEQVSLNFEGEKLKTEDPANLKVLPVNGTAYNIPLPPVNITDKGVTITFLPLREGTTFIATIDDSSGENTSKVSDLTRVQEGSSSECLRPPRTDRLFTLVNGTDPSLQPAQCEEFSVQYNSSRTGPPKIRIYSPLVAAYDLNRTNDDGAGTATYLMTAGRGFQYLLLFIDDSGEVMETTSLMTVRGDSSSSIDCFAAFGFGQNSGGNNGGNIGKNDNNNGSLDQKTVIGLAIGGGVIALIACVMVAYLVWERRHRRRVSIRFDPSLMEKRMDENSPSYRSAVSVTLPPSTTADNSGGLGPQVTAASPTYGTQGFVQNPAYAAASPRSSRFSRSSVTSWGRDKYFSGESNRNRGSLPLVAAVSGKPPSRESMQSFEDIERMLNNQEQRLREEQVESEKTRSPRALPVPKVKDDDSLASPSSVTLSQPVIGLRAIPQRGHLRDPSDVPRAPSTDVLTDLDNPFGEDNRNRSKSSRMPGHTKTPSDTRLALPPPIGGRSRFSHTTTSSFGDVGNPEHSKRDVGRRNSRIIISGLAPGRDSYATDDEDPAPRRPYPSASGLGRGNGQQR